MIYLITHLGLWLLLTAAFAALAGWSFAALRAEPAEAAARRERDKLLKDLIAISVDQAPNGVPLELDREMDTLRRRAEIDSARVAELEQHLELARNRAGEAGARIAELERGAPAQADHTEELDVLRRQLADLERERDSALHVVATPVAEPEPAAEDNSEALGAWRLRYFEQRVRYLENQERTIAAPTAEPEPAEAPDPTWQWRARTAEARVTFLEDAARAAAETPEPEIEHAQEETEPFASNAEADMLLRWRMLYLEKRVAYLQGEQADAATLPSMMDAEEAEKWKWRARYLEARARHLETQLAAQPAPVSATEPALPVQRIVEAPAPVIEEAEEEAPRARVPSGAERRPPGLPAPRGGIGDDLSLIEGVSLLQQRTLNSLGVHHFDQIAAWTPENVAWVDQYLRLRGRIEDEEWVEQAEALATEGVSAARRLTEDEAL